MPSGPPLSRTCPVLPTASRSAGRAVRAFPSVARPGIQYIAISSHDLCLVGLVAGTRYSQNAAYPMTHAVRSARWQEGLMSGRAVRRHRRPGHSSLQASEDAPDGAGRPILRGAVRRVRPRRARAGAVDGAARRGRRHRGRGVRPRPGGYPGGRRTGSRVPPVPARRRAQPRERLDSRPAPGDGDRGHGRGTRRPFGPFDLGVQPRRGVRGRSPRRGAPDRQGLLPAA